MGQGLRTGQWFMATQWSLVLRARDGGLREAEEALQSLCRSYASPVYSYIRHKEGLSREDAQDLAQEFLSRFVHNEWLKHLSYEKSFRNFLLTFLKRFLSDVRDRRQALKRGGACEFLPLTTPDAPEWDFIEGAKGLSPDEAFDRKWAEAVVTEAARKLKEEHVRRGKGALYEAIKDIVPGKHGEQSYAAVGMEIGMTEQAIKNAVQRYRARNAELLREEVAATLRNPSEAEAELRYLVSLLAR